MSSSRHLVAATTPDPEQAPLAALPGLYAELSKAVLSRLTVGGRSGFDAPLPIRAAVHDLLRSSDHQGHLGVVPGLLAMERVTRLALGDSLPDGDAEETALRRACHYLSVQSERLLQLGTWSTAATGELESIVDDVLSRVDVERVRFDWEMARRRAAERIADIDATIAKDDEHLRELEGERDACQRTIDTCYIDYEGMLFDAITAKFMNAAEPFEWYGFIVAETAWMVTAGRGLLGLGEHSQRRIVECPFECGGWVGLSADPDVANCDKCNREWPISDGQADAIFAAFREADWQPTLAAGECPCGGRLGAEVGSPVATCQECGVTLPARVAFRPRIVAATVDTDGSRTGSGGCEVDLPTGGLAAQPAAGRIRPYSASDRLRLARESWRNAAGPAR